MKKNLLNFIIAGFTLLSCSGSYVKVPVGTTGINLFIQIQFYKPVNNNFEIATAYHTIKVIKEKDFIIYEVPIERDRSHTILDKNGEIIGKSEMPTDTILRYFIYQEGKKKGIMLDSLQSNVKRPFDVDSLLKANNFNVFNLNGHVLDSRKTAKDITIEYYKPTNKGKEDPDSIVTTFDKNYSNILHFSFSKEFDGTEKGKLIECKYVYNKEDKIPRREIVMNMELCKVQNSQKILELINRIKDDL